MGAVCYLESRGFTPGFPGSRSTGVRQIRLHLLENRAIPWVNLLHLRYPGEPRQLSHK